ncbi:UNVERIFIED_CONTAM: hypothetical protein Slati_1491600 [Sesamum latifolium]|uniref:RNase H type-1 domain-containing protein n=1 Tax=Sesamum latifolium TaxID=2727402 RepID=A0AAW2X5A4_9LAMI
MAVVRGLEHAFERGLVRIWVELDAMVVLNIIKSGIGSWNFQQLLTRLRLLQRQMHIRFTHIFREGNKPADLLANLAYSLQSNGFLLRTHDALAGFVWADFHLPNF